MPEEGNAPNDAQQGVVVDDSTMENIIDKLKLLDYETEFCTLVKPPFKPLDKFYFAGPSTLDNPNMQFYYFTSLCAWLINMCGHEFAAAGQFDDPNATATTILSQLRSMNLPIPSIAPNRIKQGSGEGVLIILSVLLDQVLAKKGFSFRPIDYSRIEKYDEHADLPNGDDVVNDTVEVEDNVVIDSDDEDETFVRAAEQKDEKEAINVPVASSINAEEWNLELERVAPLLQIENEVFDNWRSRIESATILMKAVEKMYPDTKQMLERMREDMDKSRDRIQKREQTLAQQFSEQVEEYRVRLRDLNASRDAANLVGQSVQQLTVELNQVSELLDQTKRNIEDREAKISDTTPLMKVKEALNKVQTEIKQMTLRIGVLQHSVLHYVKEQTKAKREGSFIQDGEEIMLVDQDFSYY
ncbi:unnamed protein product [Phytomonas sp. EM1]|nr:unnamed protein product [Phytomonas sp. EM1]|eukprot:CCW63078.1 unnamed protein product [Phytomonas sp. isolate EM1]